MTWAQAFRDVALRFFTSNKFLPTLAFVLAITLVIKAPSEHMVEMAKVLFRTEDGETSLSTVGMVVGILGWAMAGIFLLTSIVVVAILRTVYLTEIDRVAKERDALQERLLSQPLQHSVEPKKELR